MKTSYVILLVLFYHFSSAQFLEDFQDGNFTASPEWQGDTSFFFVNKQGELQSNGPSAASNIHLRTGSSRLRNTEWSFKIRMEFDPSASNYAKVYLASDLPDLESPLNGYFLKVGGETGSTDGIDLYRQQGQDIFKIIDGIPGRAGKSLNNLRIKVLCDPAGRWQILSDTLGGFDYVEDGFGFDSTYTTASFFGIVCVHSSTRKDLFFFDDFSIRIAPVMVVRTTVVHETSLKIAFNNFLDKASAEDPLNYWLPSIGHPLAASVEEGFPDKVLLTLPAPLKTGKYEMKVSNVRDTAGHIIPQNSIVLVEYIKPLSYGDIVISEIMPDPSPSQGLPEQEFVELFNTTSDTIDLSGYVFSDPTVSAKLSSYKLPPSGYVLLTSSVADGLFRDHGKQLLLSPWPSLNNASDELNLKDPAGRLIFTLTYSSSWFHEANKKEGGWSLEMVNPKEFCSGADNWKASMKEEGGTPAAVNSVHSDISDLEGPVLLQLLVKDSIHVSLLFNEVLDSLLSVSNFYIGSPGSNLIAATSFSDPETMLLQLSEPLRPRHAYFLFLSEVKDCKGNLTSDSVQFYVAEKADKLDIIINEILFNPYSGGSDFIEVYNRSGKILDLKDWELGNLKADTLADHFKIISGAYLLHPGQYLCITENRSDLESRYAIPYKERILEIPRLPPYNDDYGSAVLIDPSGSICDRLDYKESMHFPMLDNKEGVSLERISFYSPTNQSSNWHSAAKTAGWATPGYENSQYQEEDLRKEVSVEPKVFTPDQDGWKDMAFINFRFDKPGRVGNITIYDLKGRPVRILAKNELLGTEGFYQWDGITGEGRIANTGYYIIYFETFDTTGNVQVYKETLVLSR